MNEKCATGVRSARRQLWGRMGLAALLAAFVVLPACSESTLDLGGGEIDIDVVANPATVSVGDTVFIVTSGQGTQLVGTILDYGNGVADSVGASGAQTQSLNVPVTYGTAGSYTIRATLEDTFQGFATAETVVTVN